MYKKERKNSTSRQTLDHKISSTMNFIKNNAFLIEKPEKPFHALVFISVAIIKPKSQK